jgi:hypothetical protein
MFMTLPFRISLEQIQALDEQLTHPEMAAHVSSDYGLAPEIVGVNWGMSDPIRLDHPPFDSYIEAEILATRVNERRCINDGTRQQMVFCMRAAK